MSLNVNEKNLITSIEESIRLLSECCIQNTCEECKIVKLCEEVNISELVSAIEYLEKN